MLADAKNASLYSEWLTHIKEPDVKDAFPYIVGASAALTAYRCYPQKKGEVRDFRYITDNDEQPFAFILNHAWLLFYFRAPAIRSGRYSFTTVQGEFGSAKELEREEWTVQLRSIADVQRLWRLLSIK